MQIFHLVTLFIGLAAALPSSDNSNLDIEKRQTSCNVCIARGFECCITTSGNHCAKSC
ncbi:hypothetical protein PTTW11_02889 [Pyrenophora teres f. teres]|uniref:Uncharacterized protein n=1 Tax=Pyrenophora teres f. teres TaxID=97479 RepID=A0A6S6VTE3_9PLEO|nr:hypothetical protein PTTW11_02889 [Pyrenophora teres f. teres]